MQRKWIFWFEEVGQEHNDLVGKKCANLGEMTKLGMPVPPGFCLSVDAWDKFSEETNLRNDISDFLSKLGNKFETIEQQEKASKGIRQIIEGKEIPQGMQEIIKSYFDILCQKYGTEVTVSVRSSGAKSHPGQYETYLNVKGDDLLNKIVKVWSSTFNSRSIAASVRQGLSILESPPIGMAVLKMVNVLSAGVGFSIHPGTGDNTKIFIEGSWGLGEGVVSGVTTPDQYVVDKESLDITERILGEKKIWVIPGEKGIVQEEMPVDKRQTLSLNDDEVKKVAGLAKDLELHFGKPQDIEWAIDAELPFPSNVFLVQTRPVANAPKSKDAIDRILDMMLG